MNDLDRAVEIFVQLRDELDVKRKAYKAEESTVKDRMDQIASFIEKQMGEGVDSIKTKHGTAFRATKDFVSVADWNAFTLHIQQTGDFQLLNKSANKTAVKEFMAEHKQVPPSGIEYGQKVEIQIRRPSK